MLRHRNPQAHQAIGLSAPIWALRARRWAALRSVGGRASMSIQDSADQAVIGDGTGLLDLSV